MTREDWLDDFSAVGAFLEELLETEVGVRSNGDTFYMELGDLDSGEELVVTLEYDPTLSGEALMRTLGARCRDITAMAEVEGFDDD